MADVEAVGRFQNRVLRIERRYVIQVRKAMGDMRRNLADALAQGGVGSPSLIPLIREEFRTLARKASDLRRQVVEPLAAQALWYAGRTVQDLQRAGVQIPGIETLSTASMRERQQVLTEYLDPETTAWIGQAEALFVTEVSRLRSSGAEPQEAQKRLVATTVQDGRVSTWRNGFNTGQLAESVALWGFTNGILNRFWKAGERATGEKFQRQAIAAIDERTTDTCLLVHGQIVGMKEPFGIRGRPRFGDKIMAPPFHWHCRTSTTLYTPAMERIGIPTSEMRMMAKAERKARKKTGRRVEIHPAHATSRR